MTLSLGKWLPEYFFEQNSDYMFDPEDEGTQTLWKTRDNSPNDTASHTEKTAIIKLTVQQLKIPPALYETHNFITMFKMAATGTYPKPHKSTDINFFFLDIGHCLIFNEATIT